MLILWLVMGALSNAPAPAPSIVMVCVVAASVGRFQNPELESHAAEVRKRLEKDAKKPKHGLAVVDLDSGTCQLRVTIAELTSRASGKGQTQLWGGVAHTKGETFSVLRATLIVHEQPAGELEGTAISDNPFMSVEGDLVRAVREWIKANRETILQN